MKINFVVPSTVLGGGIRVIFLYSNYLVSKGHDVVVYVPMLAYRPGKNFPIIKTSIANTFKRGTKVSWMECSFKVKLAFCIRDKFIRDADVTIASAWFTADDVYHLSPRKGKKAYFIQDYEIWNQDENKVDATYRLNMNRIVITKALKELLYNKFKVDSTVIYNGLFESEYIQTEKIMNKKRSIIMLCNVASYKGGRKGIEILERIRQKYDARIILFGINKPGGIPENFEFYVQPERKKLIALYQASDILLFPSLQEAWGLTAMEAMASKCAVVGNNTGCLKELCTDGEEALIEEFDFDGLERKVEQLINDDELLRMIQENGYQLALKLKWENSFEKLENYLFKIVTE